MKQRSEKRKKIVKFSCMSGLNAGDVIISQVMDNVFKIDYDVQSFDILGQKFNLHKRISSRQKYRVPKDIKFRNFIARSVRMIQYYVKDRSRFENAIRNADAVVIGGGQLIDDYASGHMFFRIFDIARLCAKHETPLHVGFVGVSALKKANYRRIKYIRNNATSFRVRDEESKNRLVEIDCGFQDTKIDPDPVFLISRRIECIKKDKIFIGVNVINLNRLVGEGRQDYRKVADNLCRLSQKLGQKIKLIHTAYGDDLDASREVFNALIDRGVSVVEKNVYDIEDVCDAYSDVSVMLSTRMHSAIIAFSFGVPTLIFDWHPKISAMLDEMFGDLSDLYCISDPNFDSDELFGKIEIIREYALEPQIDRRQAAAVEFFSDEFGIDPELILSVD